VTITIFLKGAVDDMSVRKIWGREEKKNTLRYLTDPTIPVEG